uniref:Uncharacterized protein n=2 Tax=Oryza TaxID=4527 RepID=A0A0D3F2D7_9ORYZ
MGAAWLGVGLQAILVMFLLMSPPFLPCALAAGCSSEGKSGDQVVGMVKMGDTTLPSPRDTSSTNGD